MRKMTTRQVELLMEACMFRINPEQRRAIMREVPDAYNAYCGYDVVQVSKVSDGEVL